MTFHAVSSFGSANPKGTVQLTLSLLAGPGQRRTEQRTVSVSKFKIGRGHTNDWVLPDPEEHVSWLHCILSLTEDRWIIKDESTNGTFLNDETRPIGKGQTRVLADLD